jgi:hypothetical protein
MRPESSFDAPTHAIDFYTMDPSSSDPALPLTGSTGVHDTSEDDAKEYAGSPQPVNGTGGVPTETPFYKKPSFLIFGAIASLVGIGLLFVLLYPVVRAIAQHIVNASRLNIDRAVIASPTNNSYVLSSRNALCAVDWPVTVT